MQRQSSDYIRSHTSVRLVQETRGAPFTVVCYGLAIAFVAMGFRFLFFCGGPITSSEKEIAFLSAFQGCKTDPWKEGWSGIIGLVLWIQAAIRIHIATTESTADLYHTMLLVTGYDVGLVFVTLRAGVDTVPPFYLGWLLTMAMYESYVLSLARRSYLVRKKMKERQTR